MRVDYVTAFIAYNYLIHYAHAHRLQIIPSQASFYNTDTVRIVQTVSFDQISKFLKVPKAVLAFLNPIFEREVIPGIKHPPYTLRLPRRKALELFKRQAAFYAVIKADSDRREKVAVDWLSRNASERLVRHRIRPEENLSVLAKRYNVRVPTSSAGTTSGVR